MQKVNYNSCPLINHDDELMTMVCLDNQCQEKGLICAICNDHHSKHKILSLKKFLFEYREQSKKWILDQDSNHCQELAQQIDQMIITLQDSSKIIQENFNEQINKLEQTKEIVKSFGINKKQEQQIQILKSIEKSDVMQKDLAQLLESVESYIPSQEFSFLLKQENKKLDSVDQRIKNAKQAAHQQQSLLNTITDTITKSNETLSTQLESLFKDATVNQSLLEETNLFNQFKSNQKFTNVQPHIQENNGKEKSLSPLEIQELAFNFPFEKQQPQQKKPLQQPQTQMLITKMMQTQQQQEYQQKSQQKQPPQPADVKSGIVTSSDSENPHSLKLINKQKAQSFVQNKEETKHKGDQFQYKQSDQHIKCNNNTSPSQFQNQPKSPSNIQPQSLKSIEGSLSKQDIQIPNNSNLQNSVDNEKEFTFQEKDSISVCSTPIMKILLIDNDTHLIVLTHSGKIIQFNYQTDQIITQQDTGFILSDAAYSILHNQLYLACKTGKLTIYTRDINKLDQPLIQNYSQTADRIGLLLVREHDAERHVFTIGEERILKSFAARTGKEVAKYDGFNDYPRILQFDKEKNQIILGGNKTVMIFDQRSKIIKKTLEIDQMITNILIDGNQIVLIMESKILYVNSSTFTQTKEKTLNNSLVSSSIIYQWHLIIFSTKQSESQLQIYCIDSEQVTNAGSKEATFICIKEFNNRSYIFTGDTQGMLVEYWFEQT